MKIAFFEIDKEDETYIRSQLNGYKLTFTEDNLDEKNAKKFKDSDIIATFINSEINKKVLEQLPNLKFITTRSTGYDNIDLEECRKGNIKASNVPFYGMNTVAEYTFGLILALLRNIHKGINKTRKNQFDIEGLEGIDLKGKTLGVIGPGNIGQHVMRYARAFDMKILTHGKKRNEKIEKEYACKFVSLNKLLQTSDIITIHVPLTKETKHMINMKNINKIKKGAYLINTARGDIIDTTALLKALDKKILSGAALDVLEGEDDIKEGKQLVKRGLRKKELKILRENNLLLKKRNVIVTPHIAFYTKEALTRILDTTVENINCFIKGKCTNEIK